MAKASLPPGFRFHPTDVELACYYLKRKIMGKPFRFEAISEIELYKFAPWDLPEKSRMQSKDLEWYFFCPGDKKYANGLRKNRATEIGYWKTTGKDRLISYNSKTVAMKKTLVFHLGRAPQGARTDWVMHEYRWEDKELADAGFLQDAYVICKIFKKSGLGPKNGEQYGAPFKEEDWEDVKVNGSSVLVLPNCNDLLNLQHNLSDDALQSITQEMDNVSHYSQEYLNIDRLLHNLSENNNDDVSVVQESNGDQIPNSSILHGTVAIEATIPDGNGIYEGLEDLSAQIDLKSAGDICFSNNMEDYALQHALLELSSQPGSDILHHTQLGTTDGSYMEMNDFQFPVEGHCLGLVDPGDLFDHNPFFQSSSSTGVPASLSDINTCTFGMEVPSGNAVGSTVAEFHGLNDCQTSNQTGSKNPILLSAGGQRKLPPESLITDEGNVCAKLRYLLGSIPARPAVAAEHPSKLEADNLSGVGISCLGSSIDVKAGVTLQCPCDDSVSASSGERMPCRKGARGSHSSGSGFAFVFFLGLVSASMWIFLLTLGAKLGKSAWKLFLSS